MSETTVVALVILVGVFVLMSITVLKAGVDAAIKMWGVMGAITGVAFGAITTYYFSDQVRKREIASIERTVTQLQTALASTTKKATDAENLVTPFYAAFRGDKASGTAFPVSFNLTESIPSGERKVLTERLQQATKLLGEIQEVGEVRHIAILPAASNHREEEAIQR
jgi:hypothetical protein